MLSVNRHLKKVDLANNLIYETWDEESVGLHFHPEAWVVLTHLGNNNAIMVTIAIAFQSQIMVLAICLLLLLTLAKASSARSDRSEEESAMGRSQTESSFEVIQRRF